MSGTLNGIKVIDCGIWVQGPVAGCLLGDLGADVIKIEHRVSGDPIRGYMPAFQTSTGLAKADRNFSVEFCNRNKRSLTLDLSKDQGRQILYKLIERVDVFIHNFRLEVPVKLGIDYNSLVQYNPRLIFAQSSGWGPNGPDRLLPAFDRTALARAGSMFLTDEATLPPVGFAGTIADILAGINLALAINSALVAREREGIGQQIDVSLLGSLVCWESQVLLCKLLTGEEYPRRTRAKAGNPLWNYYRCAGDQWIVLAMPQSDKYWHDFCEIMDIEELQHDPRFNSLHARGENAEELIRILDRRFAAKTREEWIKLFQKTDLIYAPAQTFSEVVTDPQVLANDYITDFAHPEWGPIKVVGSPYKFSKTPTSLRHAAPQCGQHTEEILLELGYTWEDICEFKDREVV